MSIIQSAWGIIYIIPSDGEPRYLLIKRHALSKKVERVAPKGKIQEGEDVSQAALREINEEAWLELSKLQLIEKVGTTQLRNVHNQKGMMDKDVTYFLIKYMGHPEDVRIQEGEGYLWIYKWATISEILGLLYYQDMRELFRKAHHILHKTT